MRFRKAITVAALASFAATGMFVAGVPKIAHANSCSTSSPLLGRTDVYFNYEGVTDGGLVSIAEWGTFSTSDPNSDCVFTRTEWQTFDGYLMYQPGVIAQNFYRKISGTWTYWKDYDPALSCPSGCAVTKVDNYMITGNPGNDYCLLNEDGQTPSEDGAITVFYGLAGPYATNPAGFGLPLTNASVCPT